MAQFAPRHSDLELLLIVRDVARVVCPEQPERTRQAAYDEARSGAGHSGTPRAYRVAKQLQCSWSQVLKLAFSEERPERTIAVRASHHGSMRMGFVLTKAEADRALNLISTRLGTKSLSIQQYDEERELIAKQNENAWLHKSGGFGATWIPSSQELTAQAGTWNKALTQAGLEVAPQPRGRAYPSTRAIRDFIEDYGFVPPLYVLLDYQAKRNLSTQRIYPYLAWLTEIEKEWRAESRWFPSLLPVRHMPSSWKTYPITTPEDGYSQRLIYNLTLEDCERDMIRALDLAGSRTLTQRLYRRLATPNHLMGAATMARVLERTNGLSWSAYRSQLMLQRAKHNRAKSASVERVNGPCA